MAMAIGNDGDGEDEVNSTINTTPLVDVMLVLLSTCFSGKQFVMMNRLTYALQHLQFWTLMYSSSFKKKLKL